MECMALGSCLGEPTKGSKEIRLLQLLSLSPRLHHYGAFGEPSARSMESKYGSSSVLVNACLEDRLEPERGFQHEPPSAPSSRPLLTIRSKQRLANLPVTTFLFHSSSIPPYRRGPPLA